MSWWDFRSKPNDTLRKKQYDEALLLVDATLARPFNDCSTADAIALLHYWHGVVLELQGDSDSALREYVSLSEAGPHSAWGKLVRLHLETVI